MHEYIGYTLHQNRKSNLLPILSAAAKKKNLCNKSKADVMGTLQTAPRSDWKKHRSNALNKDQVNNKEISHEIEATTEIQERKMGGNTGR